MDEPERPKPEQISEQPARRSREDILREIRLALAIDGLGLDERRHQVRGVDPYDNGLGGESAAGVWKGRRRS